MSTPAVVLTGRRLRRRYMLDTCEVEDAARVRDSSGGWTTSYTPRPEALPCQWGRPTDAEATAQGAVVSGKALAALSLPVDTPAVAEGARVRNPADGSRHVVVANLTPASVMAVQVRLLVREV